MKRLCPSLDVSLFGWFRGVRAYSKREISHCLRCSKDDIGKLESGEWPWKNPDETRLKTETLNQLFQVRYSPFEWTDHVYSLKMLEVETHARARLPIRHQPERFDCRAFERQRAGLTPCIKRDTGQHRIEGAIQTW